MEDRESKGPKDLFSALKDFIPEKLHDFIPKSFDVIGKLVIVEIPEELESYQAKIGTALLELHSSLKSYKYSYGICFNTFFQNTRILNSEDETYLHLSNV